MTRLTNSNIATEGISECMNAQTHLHLMKSTLQLLTLHLRTPHIFIYRPHPTSYKIYPPITHPSFEIPPGAGPDQDDDPPIAENDNISLPSSSLSSFDDHSKIPFTFPEIRSPMDEDDDYDASTSSLPSLKTNALDSTSMHNDKSKRYQCTVRGCNKSFTLKTNLTRHVKDIHHPQKLYQCIVLGCNKSFTPLWRKIVTEINSAHDSNDLH